MLKSVKVGIHLRNIKSEFEGKYDYSPSRSVHMRHKNKRENVNLRVEKNDSKSDIVVNSFFLLFSVFYLILCDFSVFAEVS